MNNRNTHRLLFAFITAFIFITICSKNSFLYPLNDWGDINCFFTVGRSLLNGKVLYQDIYEQKGPLLYFIYAILSSISSKSFFAIYVLEIFTFAFYLFFAEKCIHLYINDSSYEYIGCTILAFITVISKAFVHGGSVEEMMLFMQMYSIYVILKLIKKELIPSKFECIIIGIFCAFAFWIKYLLCGFYFGLILYILYYYIYKKKYYKQLLNSIFYFLLGFLIVSIIPFVYFIYHHALKDLFVTYFYNNLFLYSTKQSLLYCILTVVYFNIKSYILVLLLGFIYLYMNKLKEKYFISFLFLVTLLTTYSSGEIFYYYSMVIIPFSIFGIICLLNILYKDAKSDKIKNFVVLFLIIALSIAAYCFGENTYLIRYNKADLPQYQFAKIIKDADADSLLFFGDLDNGFYYTTQIIPNCKYFCGLNIPLKDLRQTQSEYIEDGKIEFVITHDYKLTDLGVNDSKYNLVSTEKYYYEEYINTFYLYQLK